jgi:hypothetical protein
MPKGKARFGKPARFASSLVDAEALQGGSRMARADVAAFMLAALEYASSIRRGPHIAW